MFQGSSEWGSFHGLILAIFGEALKFDNGTCGNVTGSNSDRDQGRVLNGERLSGHKHAVNTFDSNRRGRIRGKKKTKRFAVEDVARADCPLESIVIRLKADRTISAVRLTSSRAEGAIWTVDERSNKAYSSSIAAQSAGRRAPVRNDVSIYRNGSPTSNQERAAPCTAALAFSSVATGTADEWDQEGIKSESRWAVTGLSWGPSRVPSCTSQRRPEAAIVAI